MTAGTHEPTPAAADTDRPPLWPDADDEIIGGDLTAALAYCTPAGGAVATPVAPVGLRDRGAGTVSFTASARSAPGWTAGAQLSATTDRPADRDPHRLA